MKKIIIIESIVILLLIGTLIFISTSKNKSPNIRIKTESIISNKLNTKNLLIIGNSISIHNICEYWWGHWGMAATSKHKDYVHILSKNISKKSNINTDIVSFSVWEANSHDRSEFLELLEPVLKKNYDYIVVQLGENVHKKTATFDSDLESLLKFVTDNNKNAKIIVVGNFWKNDIVDKIKQEICNKNNIIFINLKGIQNENYQAGIGSTVLDENNEKHIIEHEGVAKHPNDKAMEYIANKIYDSIE